MPAVGAQVITILFDGDAVGTFYAHLQPAVFPSLRTSKMAPDPLS